MAFRTVDCDNIREAFAAAASATISLGGAVANSRAFSSKLSSGDTFWGAARNGAEYSIGIFTYTSGSPGTIAQTTVFYSSNSNSAVTFSSGNGEVYVDLPSHVADTLNLVERTVISASTMDIGAVDALRIVSSGTTGPVTSLGTSANKLRIVRWSGQTLTFNGTTLFTLGGVDYVTATNDISILASDGSGNWRELIREPASGWTSYTPTITSAAGSFGSVSATGKFRQQAKTVMFAVNVLIGASGKGTASGSIIVPLPVTPNTGMGMSASGVETAVNGKALSVVGTVGASNLIVRNYDVSDPIANSAVYAINGSYEAA